jgi:hypothetical protein
VSPIFKARAGLSQDKPHQPKAFLVANQTLVHRETKTGRLCPVLLRKWLIIKPRPWGEGGVLSGFVFAAIFHF